MSTVAMRSRIVLAAVQGGSDVAIGAALSVNRHTINLWRKRVAEQGLSSLWEIAPGRGRSPSMEWTKSNPWSTQPCRPNPKA
jgi:hypothetical protein